jgi:hypothetical protein
MNRPPVVLENRSWDVRWGDRKIRGPRELLYPSSAVHVQLRKILQIHVYFDAQFPSGAETKAASCGCESVALIVSAGE